MKHMRALIVVAAAVVVLLLFGCNADFWRGAAAGLNQSYEDHENRRQRVFDRWDRDRDRRLDRAAG